MRICRLILLEPRSHIGQRMTERMKQATPRYATTAAAMQAGESRPTQKHVEGHQMGNENSLGKLRFGLSLHCQVKALRPYGPPPTTFFSQISPRV